MGAMNRSDSRQSSKNKAYYDRQYDVTSRNKATKAARRKRWLARRHSPEVRAMMAARWLLRHPWTSSLPVQQVLRYTCTVPVNPKFKPEATNA